MTLWLKTQAGTLVPVGGGGYGRVLLGRVRYDAGSHTFSIGNYPGATEIVVKMVGAGASGGGVAAGSATANGAGGGGGAGAYAEFSVPVSQLSASESITVGAGPAGVSGANGSNGGNTTGFGWTCEGGLAGIAVLLDGTQTNYGVARGGNGGGAPTAGLGTLIWSSGGAGGGYGAIREERAMGGVGGDCPLGSGGRAGNGHTSTSTNGGNAQGAGGGGGGAASRLNQIARSGGRGGDGVVLIEVWQQTESSQVAAVVRRAWTPEVFTQAGDLVLGSDATQEGEYIYDPRTGICTAYGYVDVGSTGYAQGSGHYYLYLPLDVDVRPGMREGSFHGRGTRVGDFGTRKGGSSVARGGTLALSSLWTDGSRAYLTLPGGPDAYSNVTDTIPWGDQPAETTYTFNLSYPSVAPT